jgi:hypothetical protein
MSLSLRSLALPFLLLLHTPFAAAQGRLEDYQHAERFLPGNLRHLVFSADVTPQWIGAAWRTPG